MNRPTWPRFEARLDEWSGSKLTAGYAQELRPVKSFAPGRRVDPVRHPFEGIPRYGELQI